jgi:thiamine biosynthesis lipoprotein
VSCNNFQKYDRTFLALDTFNTLTIYENNETALNSFEQQVRDYEKIFSKTLPDSEVSAFNVSTDGIFNASDDFMALIGKSLSIAEAINGAFNPAIGALSVQWSDNIVPADINLEGIDFRDIIIEGNKILKNDPYLKLDLGAIAKGYICDKVIESLKNEGVKAGVLSLGGNIGVFGEKPDGSDWIIGITNPYNTDDVIGYLHMDSGFLSISGDYQRYFTQDGIKYHHILDPKTGYPAWFDTDDANNAVSSVAVWCDDGTLADALSTALFIMGTEKGMEFQSGGKYDFEVMFIAGDKVTMSDRFASKFEYKK